MMDNKAMKYRYGEFFSGPGGLSLGAIQASYKKGKSKSSIEHTWASDYDEDSCQTYIKNICPDDPDSVICQDIHKLKINKLSPIDIFAYGFPCNDFSIVGESKGFDGKFGPLYTYGLKVIRKFNPIAFVAENVGGITSANGGEAFKKILKDMEKCGKGYNISFQKYKAEEYGVPQTRHRIIIVGIRKDQNKTFVHPQPTHIKNYVSVKEVLENPGISTNMANHEMPISSPTVIERLKHIKPGENVWNADLPKHLQLNVKGAKLSQIYKRLHPKKPSYTLTGSGGGGTHGYHYKEPRPLTNRERARIQTFPDKFIFEGKYASVRKQIGMAVPPMLAKIIFNELLKQLNL
jgi:DNA (cytosine-5)-methyltransferase 1